MTRHQHTKLHPEPCPDTHPVDQVEGYLDAIEEAIASIRALAEEMQEEATRDDPGPNGA